MQRLDHFIDGKSVPPANGGYLPCIEPGTGLVYAQVADGSAADVEAAVAAATRAFPAWAATSAAERGAMLDRLADLIDAHLDEFAAAESKDSGKPIATALEVDIPRSAANFRYFAHAVQHGSGEFHDFDGAGTPGGVRATNYTLRSPRGVAGCISPWNLPLYLLTWKLAPALATGNTVVAKPSEVTPLTASMLGALANEAGIPAGVLNIVQGTGGGAGAAIVTHKDIPTITFTGSTGVGKWIGAQAGGMLKRVSLELGGKNPFIICADADLDAAIATATRAAFRNQGQICLCGSRLLVHESIAAKVRDGIVAGAKALRIGDPADKSTQFGALVSQQHRDKVASMVEMARSLGGRVLTGGACVAPEMLPERCRGGFFYAPTVIDGLDPACTVEQEEIFGPVVTMQTFKDDEEALRLANGTQYGLAATLFARDVGRVQKMTRRLAAGVIWVNCWMVRDLRTPFGGMRQSGVGREGGSEAIKFFTEPRNVCISG
ncbi:MAG: aldehyde dehydrogenase [Planctomycetota bacterium]|nr:aldehyde dehydrogenase [Planctomycetota bacterium]